MKRTRTWMARTVWAASALAVLLLTSAATPGLCGTPAEITVLQQSHFIPAWETELKKQVEAWGKQKGIRTRVDFVSTTEFDAKIVTEAETKAGHDVVVFRQFQPGLYKDSLADVDSIVNDLGNQYGGWLPIARETAFFEGRWKAVPFYHQSYLAVYRTDLFKEVGFTREQVHTITWDQVLEAAKRLHAKGKPIGFAISQTNDSDLTLYPLLWSFGASTVDKSGKVVINSPQTAKAIEYVKELAKYMPRDVMAWDDGSNNRFIMSGQGVWTINPPSIWIIAKKDVPAIAEMLDHAPMPSGPSGRYRSTGAYYLGMWKFKQSDAAADLIRYLMTLENYKAQVDASGGYNQPFVKGFQTFPVWRTNAPLNSYEPTTDEVQLQGWPGPPEKAGAAQKALVMHIVPVMFGKAVTGTSTQDAMQWAERELQQLYR